MSVKESQVNLIGKVTYTDENIPFNLEGELAKGRKSDSLLVGQLKDKNGNFSVIHFSIDNAHDGTITLDKKKLKQAKNDSGLVLKLYLLKKGTRDFTVLEQVAPSFIDKSIFKNAKELKTTDHREQFWYSKIIKPEIEITEEADTTASKNGDISILASQSTGITTSHRFTYNIAGDIWEENFRTRRTIEGPETITDSGEFIVKFYVLDEETTYEDPYGEEYYVDDETSSKIGNMDDTIVQAWVESDEAIQTVEWDGSYTKPSYWSDPSIQIGWELAALGASVGVQSAWTEEQDYEALTMKAFDNSDGEYTKNAAVKWAEDQHILEEPGHTFDHVFRVGTIDTSGTKDFSVQISYTIQNPMDEEDTVRSYDREISLTYDVD